jgi:hypothetical protein
MDGEPSAANDDAWSATVAAAVLRRGSLVHTASLILTGAALFFGAATRPEMVWLIAASLVVVLGVVEFWLAARVALDADLFDTLAARQTDLAGFDRAMRRLGLMPSAKAGRPLDARIRGAFRLLTLQALIFGLQLVVLVVFVLWA